jgi:hypothetical protein
MAENRPSGRNGLLDRNAGRVRGIEKGPVEVRQGFRGVHVLWILVASLLLSAMAYVVVNLVS